MLLNFTRQAGAALRMMLLFTVVLGLAYPLAGVAVGALMSDRTDGSLITVNGQPVASRLIGQAYDGPGWFVPRPSAAGYDAMASGGSNLGPNNPDLVAAIEERRAQVAARESVPESAVPADAVTASASGLDPHISPAYADLQVPRVARETGLAREQVRAMVDAATTRAPLGFLGEDAVNVVELNAALAAAQ